MVLAAGLALGLHGLLFSMELDWLKEKSPVRPKFRTVSVSLDSFKPQLTASKNTDSSSQKVENKKIPKSVPKLKPPVKRIKPTKVDNPPPQKTAKIEKAPVKIVKKTSGKVVPAKKPVPKRRIPDEPKPQKTLKEPPPVTKTEIAEAPTERDRPDVVSVPAALSSDNAADISRQKIARTVEGDKRPSGAAVVREATPLYRSNPAPKYPRMARRRGFQGTVVLDVLVNQNGKVGDLRVYESSGYSLLDKTALAAVRDWLFEPGKHGDKTVKMWVRVPVRFQLK
jgi:protein TonB